jgi:hypothetical protein
LQAPKIPGEVPPMSEKNWRDLCEEIVAENDAKKLLSLVTQLNEVLDNRKTESKIEKNQQPDEKIA